MRIIFAVIFLAVVATACNGPASYATATPFGLPSTWTPRPTQISHTLPTLYATSTDVSPNLLPSATLTSRSIQEVNTPKPTPFLLKNTFPKACQDEYYDEYTKISPDEIWLAESCFSDGNMQVSNQEGTRTFMVNSKDYFNDPEYPDLTGSVKPSHWTNDSQFVYFTVTPEQWNDGGFRALDTFAPLLGRMNIENGETSQILSGTFYHSFSPTDRRLIEIQQFKHPIQLIIHDLKTGTSQTFIPDNNSKYTQAANVVWSPDGLKFVFVAAFGGEYGDEVYDQPNIQSLILVDLENLSQHNIVLETTDFIEPLAWDENDVISYRVMNYDDRHNVISYLYDYQREEIIILPTATP